MRDPMDMNAQVPGGPAPTPKDDGPRWWETPQSTKRSLRTKAVAVAAPSQAPIDRSPNLTFGRSS